MKNRIYKFLVISLIVSCLYVSCREDELGDSIFDPEAPELNENSFTYNLDKFCVENFREPYNMQFMYKLSDVGSNMTYNVIPTSFLNSKKMAALVKYLWYDSYLDVTNSRFLKENSPRILHLIGCAQINPFSGTEVLGFAEGGVKVTLTKVNEINENDHKNLEKYFHTMHHEFLHILNQKKTFPREFNLISTKYEVEWQKRDPLSAACLGFVTPYAGSSISEDIAETFAVYIVWSKSDWDKLLYDASLGVGPDWEGEDGVEIILKKLNLVKEWFADSWNIDIDKLREAVHNRISYVNADFVKELLIEYGIE